MAALDPKKILAIYEALKSTAQALGVFDRVNGAEPRNPPGRGLTCSVMFDQFGPAIRRGGLAATAGYLEFAIRIETPRNKTDPEQTDRDLINAIVQLVGAYSADFELANVTGALDGNIDLLGAGGTALRAKGGWDTSGETPYRVADISLALTLNDVFPQAV